MKGTDRRAPRRSSWLLFLFGFVFLGWSGLDAIRHVRDVMTSVSVFLGLLAFAAAYCVQNLERRVASIEKHLHQSPEDRDFQETPKEPSTH
jgi:hypothetical protein